MDEKDRLLLYLLDKNGRSKESDLAKKLKLSKQVINYRIKRLISLGVIKQFQTMLNLSSLGFGIYSLIYCRFLGCSSNKEKEIIEYLVNHKKVGYVGLTGGKYDFYIAVISKDLYEFDKLVSDIFSPYKSELRQHFSSLRVFSERLPKKYLINKSELEEKINIFKESSKLFELDSIDKDIIKLITCNGRASLLEVSEKLNLPFSTVRNRVKLLEKNNIIVGYSLLLDLHPLNMLTYKILINVNDNSDIISKKLISFASNHRNISWFAKTIGGHDYEFRAVVENVEQYQQLLKEIRSEFSEVLESVESLVIFNELKEDYSVALNLEKTAKK